MNKIRTEKKAKVEFGVSEEQAIISMVDRAYELDVEQKKLAKELRELKDTLLKSAEKQGVREYAGNIATCRIGPKTTTEIGVKAFVKLLKDVGKGNLFADLLKVKITEAKRYLGEVVLEDIAEVTIEEYGSISFKPRK